MRAQRLDRVLTLYRIGDPHGEHAIFDATGSTLFPGRWNTASCPVIHTAEHYSTAMLETLVNSAGRMPPNQHFIEIIVPNGVSYEVVTPAHLPGWDDPSLDVSRDFGERWQREKRSLLLLVPSVVARMERNVVINPEHAEFHRITPGLHQPVWWDQRLFS